MTSIRRGLLLRAEAFLPPGYRRVEYLETSGQNARIDTGVRGDDITLKFAFDVVVVSRSAYVAVYGNYADENTACWRLIQPSSSGTSRYMLHTSATRKAGSSTTFTAIASGSDITGTRMHYEIEYGKLSVSSPGWTNTSMPEADGSPMSSNNIAIGARNATSTGGSYQHRFYDSFKIWQGTNLIRNYIPVVRLSDSKAGFYDLVGHTFCPSIGSADFVAGSAV